MKSTCDNSDVSEALYAIRNNESKDLSSRTFQTVYYASDNLKARLCEDPKYVMDEQEFAVFNWSLAFYPKGLEGEVGQRSTEVFWNNYTADKECVEGFGCLKPNASVFDLRPKILSGPCLSAVK